MKKSAFIVTSLLFISLLVYAATRNIENTGNWSVAGTWTGGLIPGPTDDVTMDNTVDVTVESTDNITVVTLDAANNNTIDIDLGGALTLNKTGFDALIAGNGIVINVNGTLTVNGNVQINNNLVLNVTGTLLINGNIEMNNNAQLDVAPGGVVTVDGDFTAGENADVTVDGTMDISGTINTGNNSTLDGGGTVTAGSCTGEPDFCNGGPLPIELLYFEGIMAENQIKLEWASTSEENFDFYTIEKSLDAVEFYPLMEVEGIGGFEKHDYSFIDEMPISGINYYRLKSTDLDGTFEYHKIIGVNFDEEIIGDFKMYPNPNFDRHLTIRPSEAIDSGLLQVYDPFGNKVLQENIRSIAATVIMPEYLDPGVYIVRLITDNKAISKRLIIK